MDLVGNLVMTVLCWSLILLVLTWKRKPRWSPPYKDRTGHGVKTSCRDATDITADLSFADCLTFFGGTDSSVQFFFKCSQGCVGHGNGNMVKPQFEVCTVFQFFTHEARRSFWVTLYLLSVLKNNKRIGKQTKKNIYSFTNWYQNPLLKLPL